MNKILITIFLLVSINSHAIEVNCSQLASSAFSEKIRNDLSNICKLDKFKDIVFIDNPNSMIVNQYMKQGYFFLVDKLNSLVGIPKNIYDYFYSACGNDVDNILCKECVRYDVLKRNISDTTLGNQTGFSILRERPSSCIKGLVYFENCDYWIVAGYVLLGVVLIPIAICIITLVCCAIANHIIIPCYKYSKSVDYYLHMQKIKGKVKELLLKDKNKNNTIVSV